MGNKLVKDIDEETWRKFVAICKIKGVKIGEELEKIIKDYIKKHINKIF